ncbi:TPA: hypothetical protein MJD21_10015 [Klebsiella pneumoniae]|jgi:hypothetical protein|uniref:hypothetical protein n=1 Tax=Klebsiella pneumoniae TaxID=573 RepID=UPI001EB8A1B1|nr:hypothetical protein [Klebsiella pneumoniae]MBX4707675.1 hypothetical protein [Klebsiella pneumoniae]HBW8633190.1 hypothetical protein [Klebsiella pneumoniae]HBY7172950.1 hypothetical protein [Klebsiella pneumoniae]HBZ1026360.1 hypothetical protein [Klebsiella pneumoniae]
MEDSLVYDENSIRVLTGEELEHHSADSILSILLDENPDISPDHLAKMAECLVTLGYGVNEYREYKSGTLDNIKRQTMHEWFRERNKIKKY